MTTLTETPPETLAAPASEPLTPYQRMHLDDLCITFQFAKSALDTAKYDYDAAKAELMAYVNIRGYVPTNAEKSKRCEGNRYVATQTTGTTTEIDGQQVTKLQLTLSRAKCPKVFSQLFSSRVEYTLLKGAGEYLNSLALPVRRRSAILADFALCFTVKTKTPSLQVETLKEVAERAAKATAKSAGKSAKKGGK